MMKAPGFLDKDKEKLWIEAASTATKTDNLLIRKGEQHRPHKIFYQQYPEYQDHLCTFGEKEIMTNKAGHQMKSKLEDQGSVCTFMG